MRFASLLFTLILVVGPCHCTLPIFGSITPYENGLSLWNSSAKFQHEGCSAEIFTMYSRHGTRNPSDGKIESLNNFLVPLHARVLQNIANGKSNLNATELSQWSMHYDIKHESMLTKTGQKELFSLGQRYKERFPAILGIPFDSNVHNAYHTTKSRTHDSAKSFLQGVFGEEVPMKANNSLLRSYKTCTKWKKEVDDNPEARKEEKWFLESKVFQHLLKDVSKRLGFTDEILSVDTVLAIFQGCRFDYAIREDKFSPWCSALEIDDIEILEYYDDLEHYWSDSYGHRLNYEQLCRPVVELVETFKGATRGNITKRALLRFSHQGFMLKFYARLGIFKDPRPLTAAWWSSSAMPQDCRTNKRRSSSSGSSSSDSSSSESSKEHQKPVDDMSVDQRKTRMARISQLGSNIVFTLNKCNNKFFVKTFVNEHQIKLPKCSSIMCPLEEFLGAYEEIADKCDVEKICHLNQ